MSTFGAELDHELTRDEQERYRVLICRKGTARYLELYILMQRMEEKEYTQIGDKGSLRMGDQQHEITRLLQDFGGGDRQAINQLLPLVYEQLRDLAHRQRLQWKGEDTLNTTALVHEAYLRLADGAQLDLESRRHFLRIAAKAMRYVLLDHAKAKSRKKRGGDQQRVEYDESLAISEEQADELIALDEALSRLEKINERQSQIVECRFFAGMTIEETASVLGHSTATVKRGWTMARAWLYRDIREGPTA